eukprot:SAG31_NODE_701_length_12730_cov_3.008709_4_plen_362_part_00
MDSSRSVGASHEDDRWSVPEPESAGDPDATAMHIRRHQSGQMTPPLPPQQRDFFLRDWCLICMQQVPEKSRSEHCATAVMHRQRLAARSDFMRQCVNGARRFYEAHAAGDVGSAELYQPTHPALSPIDNHKKKKKKKTTTTKKRVQGLTPKASPSIDQSLETAALLAVTPEPMSEQSSDWSADVSLAAADTTARRHRSKPQSFVRNGTPTDRNSVPRLSLSGSESRRRSIEKATALPKKKSKKVERSVNGTKGVGRTMWSPPAESPSHPVRQMIRCSAELCSRPRSRACVLTQFMCTACCSVGIGDNVCSSRWAANQQHPGLTRIRTRKQKVIRMWHIASLSQASASVLTTLTPLAMWRKT